jgi:hypothetical protein
VFSVFAIGRVCVLGAVIIMNIWERRCCGDEAEDERFQSRVGQESGAAF